MVNASSTSAKAAEKPRTMCRARISSLATYVPPKVLTNADLEKMVETSDEWILQRTGIRERHIVEPGVATSDLATEAAKKAIERAGLTPDDIDFIVVGTTTPDMLFPSTACLVQHKIGASRAWGYDLFAACSGFTYALTTAAQMVSTGASKHALVIGADVMSSIIDYTDRTTCVIFGDGAGAAVVEASDDPEIGIIDFENYVDGSGGDALCMPAGGSKMPASFETVQQRLHYVKQDGGTVFRFAVRNTEEACARILARNNLTAECIDLMVSHQANRRIILSAAERLGVPEEKVVINIEKFGNTTAATIPLALSDAVDAKRLKRGDTLLMVSVGAGFTVGALLLKWGLKERWALGVDSAPRPRALTAGQEQRLKALRHISRLLDSAFVLPGTGYRIGLDPILGLVPGLGDLTSPLFAIALLWQSRDLGIPRVVQLRMIFNVAIDALVGLLPVAGDLFDFAWKANDRNIVLLERHAYEHRRPSATDWLFVSGMILLLLVIAAIPFLLAGWLISVVASVLSR